MKTFVMMILVAMASSAVAHEMTPTYPKLIPSHVDGIYKTKMKLFNKRADVEFYEIGVFDKQFKAIPFVSSYRILNIKYLNKVTFDIYIREKDIAKAHYVCSRSKLRKENKARTAISSRICSLFKQGK